MCAKMFARKTIWCIFVIIPHVWSSGNKCLKNGLYEHSKDCDKFYSCAPFGPVLMHCPAGLHFNPQYLICDWPQNAGCEGERAKESGNDFHETCPVYPDPKDCTKYYFCSPSGTALIQCPENLRFNPKLLVCDWPQNVECIEENTSTDSAAIASEYTETLVDGISNISESTSVTPTQLIAENTTILTTFFISESTETLASTQNNELLDTSTVFESNQSNLSPLCNSNIWPHPSDCTKFFMCGSTGPVEKFCPEQTYFNPVLLVCDWAYRAGCKNENSEMTTTELTEEASAITGNEYLETTSNGYMDISTTEEDRTQELTALESTTEKINSAEPCKLNIWPHPHDCTKFLMYSATGVIEMSCPKQLQFNPESLICDWPQNSGCEIPDVTTLELTTVEASTTIHFWDVVTTEPISSSTIEYFENITMDDIIYTATEPTTTFGINNTELCKGSIWPHPDDCTRFFMCGSTGAVEKICPEELHFDPVLLVCDLPPDARCEEYLNGTAETALTDEPTEYVMDISNVTTNFLDDITTDPSNETTTEFTESMITNSISSFTVGMDYPETTTMENLDKTSSENLLSSTDELLETTQYALITTEETSSSAYTSVTVSAPTTTFKSINSELCQAKIWPHPDDCTKFFLCSSTGAVELSCSEALHFNPVSLVCDWPDNAGCIVIRN